ncbi:NAD(P)-dependent oxidoreductase [Actinomadura keratinilytica]|uniref:Phosphoglycerate dehydrogenase n=1 Tax=Actinomadura keratinilytica TaxID=547461 RepID=A0ABP7ZAD6_9ACTN
MNGTVLVTSRSFGRGRADCERRLAAAGLRVVRGSTAHDLDALRPVLADAAAWIAGTAPITDEHLAAAPGLRVVARYGVGVDNVDLRAAAARGVTVTNTPGANSPAVADLAVGALLAELVAVVAGDRDVRGGDWRTRRGRELGALTVGVAGYGRIGRGVARRVRGFGAEVLAYDPYAPPGAADGVRPAASIAELAERCDAVSLHAPGGAVLADAAWLARLRPGAVLVNTARADLVDEAAVAEALRGGRLAAYAADTLAGEGRHDGPPAGSPLLAPDLADRVVVTPHIGAQTVEAVDRMGQGAADAVLDALAGRTPAHVVPVPA